MAAPVVQLRVPEATLARLDEARGGDTRSAWVLRLIDRELGGQAATRSGTQLPVPAALADLGDGEPSPGVLCAGPGCFQRDTARYGLRRLVLCPACRAALEGQEYRRPVPPGAARVIRGTAA